jgi:hypothetical protein
MLNWLENYYKREDGKFMRIIQDADYSEKYLSDLYQGRKNISVFLVLALFLFLLTIAFSINNDPGIYLSVLALLFFLYMTIDVQIKMILLINYIKSTFKFNNSINPNQNENH